MDAWILQPDGVEHTRWCLPDARLLVARAGMKHCSLADDRAEPVYLGDPGIFHAIAKGARGHHDRIFEQQAAFMLWGKFCLQVHGYLYLLISTRNCSAATLAASAKSLPREAKMILREALIIMP